MVTEMAGTRTPPTHEIDRLDYTRIRAGMLQQDVTAGDGPFAGTPESLCRFRCPEWFRDAKFGIWAHWGPQGLTGNGDWYARKMYMQGQDPVYDYHLEHFGHPSRFGYKDLLPLWKAERFDPDALMQVYKDAGARYFVALAVHTDNFDCWNSTYHRWNAVNIGPGKDIVGLWRDAARRQGLRFGVSEHISNYYYWLGTSRGCDKTGPLAGVPYDGNDPRYQDLYNSTFVDDPRCWITPDDYPDTWAREWYFRMKDLLDAYEPDLFYTDGALALGTYSLNLVAYFYNRALRRGGAPLDAVYTSKNHSGLGTYIEGAGVLDIERGLAGGITEEPWQIDTCLGDWFYKKGIRYKTPRRVLHFLVDVVSKNGNMLLSVPLRPDGTPDDECLGILGEIEAWLEVNGEAVYETRPWKTYGEGVVEQFEAKCHNENPLEPKEHEFRFTTRGHIVYAFIMKWPEQRELLIKSFAGGTPVGNVEILGGGTVDWTFDEDGLHVTLPHEAPCRHASVLKVQT